MSIFEYDEELARQAALEDGEIIGREKDKEETLIFSIKNLMRNLNLNAEQAMNALDIPENDQKTYKEKLSGK